MPAVALINDKYNNFFVITTIFIIYSASHTLAYPLYHPKRRSLAESWYSFILCLYKNYQFDKYKTLHYLCTSKRI